MFSSLLFTLTSINWFYSPPPLSKSFLKLICNVNIVRLQYRIDTSNMRTLKIIPRNLNEIVRSWIRLLNENMILLCYAVVRNLRADYKICRVTSLTVGLRLGNLIKWINLGRKKTRKKIWENAELDGLPHETNEHGWEQWGNHLLLCLIHKLTHTTLSGSYSQLSSSAVYKHLIRIEAGGVNFNGWADGSASGCESGS